MLGLCCCLGFSLVMAVGFLFSWGAWACNCSGFFCCGARALGHTGLVVVPRLSFSAACGIFLVQGSNPCLLHSTEPRGKPTLLSSTCALHRVTPNVTSTPAHRREQGGVCEGPAAVALISSNHFPLESICHMNIPTAGEAGKQGVSGQPLARKKGENGFWTASSLSHGVLSTAPGVLQMPDEP